MAHRRWVSLIRRRDVLLSASPRAGGPEDAGIRVGVARVLLDQAAPTEGNHERWQGFAHDAARRWEALLLNSSEILANVLGERLAEIYTRAFSSCEPRYAEIIGRTFRMDRQLR